MTRYSLPAIGLHWAIALIIFASFPLGLYMVELPLSPAKLKLYSYHKWAGVTVFVLALVRLAWRWVRPAPPMPDSIPAWQRHVAGAAHALLYLLMIGVPVSGWLMSSALGFQTVYFGVLPIPDALAKDKVLGQGLVAVHVVLTYALAGLVAAHAAGALKHHLIDRDSTLFRMLPIVSNPEESR